MSFPAKIKLLFEKLKESDQFTPELAQKLCDIQYCERQSLQTEFPVLRDKGKSGFDSSGQNRRYYPSDRYSFIIENKEYIFTNNWVERNSSSIIKFFEKYLDSKYIKKTLSIQHSIMSISLLLLIKVKTIIQESTQEKSEVGLIGILHLLKK